MKKELGISIIFFLIMQVLTYTNKLAFFVGASWIGLILLLLWIALTFVTYSERKVSEYSNTYIKIQLRKRWYQYIFLPVTFYILIVCSLYLLSDIFFRQFITIISVIYFFIFFINVKSSYEKIFTIETGTRVVFLSLIHI